MNQIFVSFWPPTLFQLVSQQYLLPLALLQNILTKLLNYRVYEITGEWPSNAFNMQVSQASAAASIKFGIYQAKDEG